MDREVRKRAIAEQLMRVEYHGNALRHHRKRIEELEHNVLTALENVNAAKRELYELGWKG